MKNKRNFPLIFQFKNPINRSNTKTTITSMKSVLITPPPLADKVKGIKRRKVKIELFILLTCNLILFFKIDFCGNLLSKRAFFLQF